MYCDEYVCLFVCPLENSKTTRPNVTKFLCMLPMVVAWFSLYISGFVDDIIKWGNGQESSTALCLENCSFFCRN